MIRDIWAPSDLLTEDKDPSVSVEDKLAIIARSRVVVKPSVVRGAPWNGEFSASLPFISGGSFSLGLGDAHNKLLTEYVSLGDDKLYGNGIGSLLLRSSIRFAVEQDERTDTFCTGWVRLGLINTTVSVLGQANVAVTHGKQRYGWRSDKPLEAMFDDKPAVPGQPYVMGGIEAHIDRDLAMTWEKPEYKLPELL